MRLSRGSDMTFKSPFEHVPAWPVVQLRSVTTKIGSGSTPTGGQSSYQSQRSVWALVRSQNVFDRRFDSNGLAFISDAQAEKLKGAKLEQDDLLLNITGDGATFARSCVIPEDILPACVNQHVAIVRVDRDAADHGYVLSYLTHPVVKSYIESFNAGGSRRAITKANIESFALPLPPLPEQRAIARILSTLDDKIELNRRMNETLEAIARTIFKSLFVDFDPVRAKVRGEVPESICRRLGLTPALLAHFPDRFVDSELGEIPAGWEVRGLNTVAPLSTASISPSTQPNEVFEHYSIPAFDAAVFPAYDLGRTIKSNKYIVSADAVLVSKLNPETPRVWMPAVATERAVCSTEFMQFVPQMANVRAYLYLLMCSERMQTEVLKRVTGSTGSRQRAQPSEIATLPVFMPPESLLKAFDAIASPTLDRIARNREQSQTLCSLRDTLLPKLLSGELRVPLEGAA
jgi:type I restriction enzyme, S subunit